MKTTPKAPIKTHHKAKLTRDQVNNIRDLYEIGFSIQALAKMFGMGTTALWSIVTNQTWRDPDYTPKRGQHVLPIQSNVQG